MLAPSFAFFLARGPWAHFITFVHASFLFHKRGLQLYLLEKVLQRLCRVVHMKHMVWWWGMVKTHCMSSNYLYLMPGWGRLGEWVCSMGWPTVNLTILQKRVWQTTCLRAKSGWQPVFTWSTSKSGFHIFKGDSSWKKGTVKHSLYLLFSETNLRGPFCPVIFFFFFCLL